MLLSHQNLSLQDGDLVAAALQQFSRRPAVGFSDCLVLEAARRAGHLPLGTFDRNLARLEGTQRLGQSGRQRAFRAFPTESRRRPARAPRAYS